MDLPVTFLSALCEDCDSGEAVYNRAADSVSEYGDSALDEACVKAPSDVPRAEVTPHAEHTWMSDVDFDGWFVSGVLLNAPNCLKTVKEGDSARIPLGEIGEYVISGEVFGSSAGDPPGRGRVIV